MDESRKGHARTTRRRWVAHCTALLFLGTSSWAWPAASQSATASGRTILVVGDSLSAEYGLTRGAGWVALLQARLRARPGDWQVVNASISGDTTSGGRSRLATLLAQHHPAVVVLELGGNDALRGLPIDMTRANLVAMAQTAKQAGAKVLVAGIQIPPNYGHQYSDRFAAVFGDVARTEGTALVPSILKGVADAPNAEELFQPDRIHPIAAAHPTILATVWPELVPLLK